MFHKSAHRDTDHPAAQIRNGEVKPDAKAALARRHELYGAKARKADAVMRQAIKRQQQAQEMVRKAMQANA